MRTRYRPFTRATTGLGARFDDPDQAVATALVTVGAFVAAADGSIEAAERLALVNGIACDLALPTARLGEMFDHRVRRLRDADCAELIIEALRPLACFSLQSGAIRLGEQIAAADGHMHPNELRALALIRLVLRAVLEPKLSDGSAGG